MKKGLYFVIYVLVLCSCDDIIEVVDISDNTVNILAPAANSSVNSKPIVFTWESVEEATSYRLQVASPNFENATQIVVDTLLLGTNYTKDSLKFGGYQWRVQGVNSYYQTAYTTISFGVEN